MDEDAAQGAQLLEAATAVLRRGDRKVRHMAGGHAGGWQAAERPKHWRRHAKRKAAHESRRRNRTR